MNNQEDVEGRSDQTVTLIKNDFYEALKNFTPSLNENEIRQYERLQKS
jgi:hypothetical protein